MKPRLTERLARLEEAAKLHDCASAHLAEFDALMAELLTPDEYAALPAGAGRGEALFRAFVHYLTGAYPPTGPDPEHQGGSE